MEKQERKTWSSAGLAVVQYNEVICISIGGYAGQIVNDHNRISELGAENAKLKQALHALVEAASDEWEDTGEYVDRPFMVPRDAIEQARAALLSEGTP